MRRPGNPLKPEARAALTAVSKVHGSHFAAQLDAALEISSKDPWTTRYPPVVMLQLVEKIGVRCGPDAFINHLLLLPRYCCCDLNLAFDSSDELRLDDTLAIAPLITHSLLLNAALKNASSTDKHKPRSSLLKFLPKATTMSSDCQTLLLSKAVIDNATIQEACETRLEPCRILSADVCGGAELYSKTHS